jgi:DNA-binding GntR family transcriptional regulator
MLTPAAQLALLRNETVQRLVQREIERMILDGELTAGQKINENEIARRLDVSRAPVREALRTLEEADLVCFEKNRGVTVRKISLEEAKDIYELRAALEEIICRRVATRITPEQVAELRALDISSYHESNVLFHERLAELAGSREFAGFYRTLINKLMLFRRRTLGQGGAVATSNLDHQAIVRHLAAGDADAAGRAMHKHIIASGRRMRRALHQFFENHEESEATVRERPRAASRYQ